MLYYNVILLLPVSVFSSFVLIPVPLDDLEQILNLVLAPHKDRASLVQLGGSGIKEKPLDNVQMIGIKLELLLT